MRVLGVHSGHGAGACLLEDGEIVTAAQEERFNRLKNYGYIPLRSVEYCLDEAGISPGDVDRVVTASQDMRQGAKLLLDASSQKYISSIGHADETLPERALQVALENPQEFPSRAIRRGREMISDAFDTGSNQQRIPDYVDRARFEDVPVFGTHHHEAHAASAYYTCGNDESLVITLDGYGDGLSGAVWEGRDGELNHLQSWTYEGSLGWFYASVTEALGWWVGNGEGKTMGLAASAEPDEEVIEELRAVAPRFEDGELVDGHDFTLEPNFTLFDTGVWSFEESEYVSELIETHTRKQVAAAAQALLEEQVLNIVRPWVERTDADNLATAGGIFLNVALNRRLHNECELGDYFIFPNCPDSGLPMGAAFLAYADAEDLSPFRLQHAYWGPRIETTLPDVLDGRKLDYSKPDDITEAVADRLADGKLIAWCQGRMEYGPRALGNRSILVDPRNEQNKDRVNETVKFRESWRPFAPSILEEAIDDYFVRPRYDPFMITSNYVLDEKKDEIPAVVHVNGTARPQVVREEVNPRYWRLLKAFEARTGTPVVLNTSYNLSGDPIVCSARDAVTTFYDSGLDALALGDYLLEK